MPKQLLRTVTIQLTVIVDASISAGEAQGIIMDCLNDPRLLEKSWWQCLRSITFTGNIKHWKKISEMTPSFTDPILHNRILPPRTFTPTSPTAVISPFMQRWHKYEKDSLDYCNELPGPLGNVVRSEIPGTRPPERPLIPKGGLLNA